MLDRKRRLFAFSAAAVVTFGVIGLAVSERYRPRYWFPVQSASPSAPASLAVPRPEWKGPIIIRPGSPPDPGPVRVLPSDKAIYRCDNGGQVVLSNIPCGNIVEVTPIP